MRIGLLVADGGDGSSSIRFFRSIEKAEEVREENEEYFTNEDVTEIEVPDDFTPPGFWADDDDDF